MSVPEPSLPIADGSAVPVFDCHVILTPPGEGIPQYRGRVSRAPWIEAVGGTERECLRALVDRYKSFLKSSLQSEVPIAWADPPLVRGAGDVERWIPVHL